MTLTLKDYENANAAILRMRTVGQIRLSKRAVKELLDVLSSMLGGDPWQEGASAVDIIDILDKQS